MSGTILIRLHRPAGYEDIAPELVMQDAGIDPAFMPELVKVEPTAPAEGAPAETAS